MPPVSGASTGDGGYGHRLGSVTVRPPGAGCEPAVMPSRTTNVAPPPGVASCQSRPPWAATMAATIDEAQPGAAAVARAARVGAVEAVEDAGGVLGVDARAVVDDAQLGLGLARPEDDLHRRSPAPRARARSRPGCRRPGAGGRRRRGRRRPGRSRRPPGGRARWPAGPTRRRPRCGTGPRGRGGSGVPGPGGRAGAGPRRGRPCAGSRSRSGPWPCPAPRGRPGRRRGTGPRSRARS